MIVPTFTTNLNTIITINMETKKSWCNVIESKKENDLVCTTSNNMIPVLKYSLRIVTTLKR